MSKTTIKIKKTTDLPIQRATKTKEFSIGIAEPEYKSSRGRIVYDSDNIPTLVQSADEKPVQMGFPPCNGAGKIIGILIPSNRKVIKNLVKHFESGEIKKIKEQIKRGSVKYFDTNK